MLKIICIILLLMPLSLFAQDQPAYTFKVRKINPDSAAHFINGNWVISRADFLGCDSLETIMDYFVKNRNFKMQGFQLNILKGYTVSSFESSSGFITKKMRDGIATIPADRIYINDIRVAKKGEKLGIRKVIFILN